MSRKRGKGLDPAESRQPRKISDPLKGRNLCVGQELPSYLAPRTPTIPSLLLCLLPYFRFMSSQSLLFTLFMPIQSLALNLVQPELSRCCSHISFSKAIFVIFKTPLPPIVCHLGHLGSFCQMRSVRKYQFTHAFLSRNSLKTSESL